MGRAMIGENSDRWKEDSIVESIYKHDISTMGGAPNTGVSTSSTVVAPGPVAAGTVSIGSSVTTQVGGAGAEAPASIIL